MNDYVQPVAKAYADGSPDLNVVAKRQLEQIEAERGRLQTQAYTIRQLVALASAAMPTPSASVTNQSESPLSEPEVFESAPAESNGTGTSAPPYVTEDQKQMARELWEGEMRAGRDLTSQQVVELMRGRGVLFGVAQPAAAIGTTLASVRRGWMAAHAKSELSS